MVLDVGRLTLPPAVAEFLANAGAEWSTDDRHVRITAGRSIVWGRASDEIRGWIAGLSMFEDVSFVHLMQQRGQQGAVPFALAAFVHVLTSGVPAPKRAWMLIEQLVGRNVPIELAAVIPIAAMSDLSGERGIALKLAHRIGEPARVALEAARATASPDGVKCLDAALAALAGESDAIPADEPIDLLRRLVAAWGPTRDPELEEPIIRIGMQIAQVRGALAGKSKSELEGKWLALAAKHDAGDVDRLLDAEWPGAWAPATIRVKAIGEFPPDPRIANKLMQMVSRYSALAADPFRLEVANVVERMLSPTLAPALEVHAERWRRGGRFNSARNMLALLETRPADPALLAEARATESEYVNDLHDQHAANPGDLGLRAVLADALQAVGDPRGEFIALQTRIAEGDADAVAHRRAAQLLAANQDRWIRRLPGVVRESVRFERGFLVALRSSANQAALDGIRDVREWATVEHLTLLETHVDVTPLLARMSLLKTLWVPSSMLERLATQGPFPQLRALGCATPARMLADLRAFPNLAVLGGHWYEGHGVDVGRQVKAMVYARDLGLLAIAHLGISLSSVRSTLELLSHGPPEMRIGTGNHYFDAASWRIRIFRDTREAHVEWVTETNNHSIRYFEELLDALDAHGISARFRVEEKVRPLLAAQITKKRFKQLRFDGPPVDLSAADRT